MKALLLFSDLFATVAEIPIQRKKPPLSPWLLVALAAAVLTLAAYWFLPPAPADEPAPRAATPAANPILGPAPADSVAANTAAAPPDAGAAAPRASYARTSLLQMVAPMSELTDRADLRDDATVREQRDNLTSATARLADGDAQASLRPGLVAAANLLRAVQQKAYPALDDEAARLAQQAGQLSGRDSTATEQQQNRQFLQAAAALLQAENAPPAP